MRWFIEPALQAFRLEFRFALAEAALVFFVNVPSGVITAAA